MSRDLTPRELDTLQKQYNMPNLIETMTLEYDGKSEPFYSDDQKALVRIYPRLGMFGFDLLNKCYQAGILKSQIGKDCIDQIEAYFQNGEKIRDTELQECVILWYLGELVPGYYMTENDEELVRIILEIIHTEEDITQYK